MSEQQRNYHSTAHVSHLQDREAVTNLLPSSSRPSEITVETGADEICDSVANGKCPTKPLNSFSTSTNNAFGQRDIEDPTKDQTEALSRSKMHSGHDKIDGRRGIAIHAESVGLNGRSSKFGKQYSSRCLEDIPTTSGCSNENALTDFLRQGTVKSTDELITVMDGCEDQDFRIAVQNQAMQSYIEWFESVEINSIVPQQLEEYARLCMMEAETEDEKKWMRKWFRSWCSKVEETKHGQEDLMESLQFVLRTMDPDVFNGDPDSLIKLANQLLVKVDPEKVRFTEGAFRTHGSILHALHQVFHLVCLVDSVKWNMSETKGVFANFNLRIREIAEAASNCYPVHHVAMLVEQSLRRLASDDEKPDKKERFRRRWQGVKGVTSLCQSLWSIASLRLELQQIETGCKDLQDALRSSDIKEKSWYEWLMALMYTAELVLEDASNYAVFVECLDKVQEREKSLSNPDRKALRFGIIGQLCMLSLSNCGQGVTSQAVHELVCMVSACKISSDSIDNDPDILKLALESLAEICAVGREAEAIQNAIHTLASIQNKPLQGLIKKCYECKVSAGKMRAFSSSKQNKPFGSLFDIIRDRRMDKAQKQLVVNQEDLHDLCLRLRDRYSHEDFAKITSFVTEKKHRHVSLLEFHLRLVDSKSTSVGHHRPSESDDSLARLPSLCESNAGQLQCGPSSRSFARTKSRSNRRIHLEDIFWAGAARASDKEDANKILITGEPGTGKTSLSHRLAYDWSVRKWGTQFSAVFVLPGKKLSEMCNDNSHQWKENVLATAITRLYFPEADRGRFRALRMLVEDQLKKTTTLLILDCLEECTGHIEAIFCQEKTEGYKLLMISRPDRAKNKKVPVDMEIELAGLTDAQLTKYVEDEKLPCGSQTAIDYMKCCCTQLWEIAHIPINLHVLCELWKECEFNFFEAKTGGKGCVWLYKKLTDFVWRRDTPRTPNGRRNPDDVFDDLGKVALDAVKSGQKVFSLLMLTDHIKDPNIEEVYSGFLVLKSEGNYEFPHIALLDYFGGRLLGKCLFSYERERRRAEEILQAEKYNDQYRLLFSFMAGTIAIDEGFDGIKRLLSLLNQGNVEVSGVQHLGLQMEFLQRWLCETGDSARGEFIHIDLEFKISKSLKRVLKRALETARLEGAGRGCDDTLLKLFVRLMNKSSEVVRLVPALLDIIMNEMKLTQWKVCDSVVEALAEVINAADEINQRFIETLESACQKKSVQFRHGAISVMRRLVKHSNKCIPFVVKLLKSLSEDRSAKAWVFIEIISQSPEHITELFGDLICASDDDYSVLQASACIISEISKTCPELLPPLIGPLMESWQEAPRVVTPGVVQILGAAVSACPEQASEILELLLSTLTVNNENLTVPTATSLAEVILAFPDFISKIISALNTRIEENNWTQTYPYLRATSAAILDVGCDVIFELLDPFMKQDKIKLPGVQAIVLDAAIKISKVSPNKLSQVVPLVMETWRDPEWKPHQCTFYSMSMIGRNSPEYLHQIVDVLKTLCHDKEHKMHCEAMVAVWEIIQVAPDHTSDLVKLLIDDGISDEHEDVRKKAAWALKNVIKSATEDDEELLKALIEKYYETTTTQTKHGIISTLLLIVAEIPEHIPMLVDVVVDASKDLNEMVCTEAVEALGIIAKLSEENRALVEKLLLEACQRTEHTVCFRALSVFAEAVLNSDNAADFAQLLLGEIKCSTIKEWQAYFRSVSAALDIMPQTEMELLMELLKYLLDGFAMESCEVSELRAKIIREKPLKQLLEWYWLVQSDVLIPHIASKIDSTPLVLLDHQIQLYGPNGGEMDKPKHLITKLRRQIQNHSKKKERSNNNWPKMLAALFHKLCGCLNLTL